MSGRIVVEVVLAHPNALESWQVELPTGSRVRDALAASGFVQAHPEVDVEQASLGVYGKQVKLDAELRDRDRIEIYRPLKADPKEVRRKRAADGKAMRKGGGAEQDR
ncbi:RnfH family protein [Niveibacterium sp. SC-1]|uniref:RnfH family protein n=1 Tax=Niveibacterium sp. SC-1 TaxID=3135646 RepID=UPI00311E5535